MINNNNIPIWVIKMYILENDLTYGLGQIKQLTIVKFPINGMKMLIDSLSIFMFIQICYFIHIDNVYT